MTRKNKKSNAPITWYGGRFPCEPLHEDLHLFLWGTLTKEIASKVLPQDAPDSALLDLYNEAIQEKPNIVHFIDERLLGLGKSLQGVTLKSGKREAFLELVTEVLTRVSMEQAKANPDFGSYLAGDASSEEVAAFFSTAASFYRVKPWEIFTCSGFLFRLDAPALGLIDCLVSLEAFVSERGAPLILLKLDADEERDLELEFIARDEARDELAKEIDEHQWELASPDVFPLLVNYHTTQDDDITSSSLRMMRAALEAVLMFITKHRHLSLLPEVKPVTESLVLSWLPQKPEVRIMGPHPDFDFFPYESSEGEFDEDDEDFDALDDDLDEDDIA